MEINIIYFNFINQFEYKLLIIQCTLHSNWDKPHTLTQFLFYNFAKCDRFKYINKKYHTIMNA